MTAPSEQWQETGKSERYARQSKIGSRLRYAPLAREIMQRLPKLEEGATIVDLGIGPGLLALELHKRWPQAKIVGVDPSDEMLSIARRNAAAAGISNLETKRGSAEELPLGPESADVVISQSSFHEWEDPRRGLGQVLRVLKPGGSLIVKDYNGAWLSSWKRRLLGRFHHLEMFRYTYEEVADLLAEAGFHEVRGEDKGWQYLVQGVKAPSP